MNKYNHKLLKNCQNYGGFNYDKFEKKEDADKAREQLEDLNYEIADLEFDIHNRTLVSQMMINRLKYLKRLLESTKTYVLN